MAQQVGFQFGSMPTQERTSYAAATDVPQWWDACQPFDAAAPHQIQKQRLGLIVSMVRGKVGIFTTQQLADGLVTTVTRFLLCTDSAGRADIQFLAGEWNVTCVTEVPAMIQPGIGSGVKAVMKMNCMNGSIQAITAAVHGEQKGC